MFDVILDQIILKNITKNTAFRAHPDKVRVCVWLNAIKKEHQTNQFREQEKPKKMPPIHT